MVKAQIDYHHTHTHKYTKVTAMSDTEWRSIIKKYTTKTITKKTEAIIALGAAILI